MKGLVRNPQSFRFAGEPGREGGTAFSVLLLSMSSDVNPGKEGAGNCYFGNPRKI